ncbi:hypothetical protein YC2023_048947 [Brassica napus]
MNGTKAFREKCSFRSKISEVILAFVYQGMQTIFDSVCSLLLFESHMPITGGVIAVDVQKNRTFRRQDMEVCSAPPPPLIFISGISLSRTLAISNPHRPRVLPLEPMQQAGNAFLVVLKMLPEMGIVENIQKFIEGVREQVNLMLETTWFYFGLVMSLSINIIIRIPLNSLEDEDI